MIQPDALPVRIATSRAVLASADVPTLFGSGYKLRGSEHVLVVRSGRAEVRVPVAAGSSRRLVLDALDRDALGEGAPLRFQGPAGSAEAPMPEPVGRALRLPAALVRAWGLKVGQTISVQTGAVAFGDVTVEEGEGYVWLDRTAALAAGLQEGDTARWNPQFTLTTPLSPAPFAPAPTVRATGRLITENDVRQARLRGQKIVVRPDHIITPAAHSLGRELGVLRDS